ncbi:hypothetical protein PHLGIDRAFT_282850 [Phlebiopsis gigantea 11061_1 CR5-6]|uniref:Uncharacterized protein n=1 Tax=Phlebiopsis gigantea (strain 11061_1 CR5-6) TaxID=745531 RepID=A0A0C3SBI5_PHLG1|nr:hypothetical protein PHLGIDRAFT_282850 [Phlebiopsis gigantea 11061_1 CR5-6]
MAQTKTPPPAARRGSIDSLDIQTAMNKYSSSNLLTVSFSSIPSMDSTHSFGQISDYPHATCSTPLFLTLNRTPTLLCPEHQSLARSSNVAISVPTLPRMRLLLTEPISVARWMEQSPLSAAAALDDLKGNVLPEGSVTSIWKPEGSMFSPEEFEASLRQRRTPNHRDAHAASLLAVSQSTDASCNDLSSSTISGVDADSPAGSTHQSAYDSERKSSDQTGRADPAAVPTIMLSNSTAAMPLSFESSLSIAPLAARRGRKVPAPLELSSATLAPSHDLYPGIPSPFLGSPSSYSPKFEFSQNPEEFSMNLAAMCQDLRSRCPPLHPPSPTGLQPFTPVDPLTDSDSSLSSDYSKSDSDDWAFAKEILAEHLDLVPQDSAEYPLSPVSDAAPAQTSGDHEADSYSWASAPTLTNSPQTSISSEPRTSAQDTKVDPVTLQRRRRTVIIETPHKSAPDGLRPARVTIDLSHLADDSTDASMTTDFDTPLPLEISVASPLDNFVESTPRHLRPVSSATLRMPIRGILKTREKKRVRFSFLPGMDGEDGGEAGCSFDVDEDEAAEEPRRKRAATTPLIRPGSLQRPRSAIPTEFAAQRASFPKRPLVKPFVRHSTANDVSPTPTSRTARQSMPLVPRVVDKGEVGSPRKLSSIARRSMPAVDTKKKHAKPSSNDENSGRRHNGEVKPSQKATSPPKSRMPFRAIFTKLRS